MDQHIDFESDRDLFISHLLKDFKALEIMLERGMIESGITRMGAEQELCLVNDRWNPAPIATDILDLLEDPHIVTEYARFNLEINLDPRLLAVPVSPRWSNSSAIFSTSSTARREASAPRYCSRVSCLPSGSAI